MKIFRTIFIRCFAERYEEIYIMKKLNISLLLLVFCVSGSLSCRSIFRPKQKKIKTTTKAAEPGLSASDFFRAETQRAETPRTQVKGAAEPGLSASDLLGLQRKEL